MTRIELHGEEHVHMEPRRLDGSEPIDMSLLPYAIIGAHVEDTVSSPIDGGLPIVHRVVVMPVQFHRVKVTYELTSATGATSGPLPTRGRAGDGVAEERSDGNPTPKDPP